MLNPVNLDEREKLIYEAADQFWATRMLSRGARERLGPFATQQEAEVAAMAHMHAVASSISQYLVKRPFTIYASSTRYGMSHVCVGNVHMDGKVHLTHKEVSLRRQEERERARKQSRNRRNE